MGEQVLPDPGVACTDHSDCTVLGHRYGCLLYRCADYTDTSRRTCQAQEDCCQGEEDCQEEEYTCVRTYLPPHPEGFCLYSSSMQSCSSQSPCPGTGGLTECCGEWCCPTEFYSQWQNFSCFSHTQCRAWSTGQYCCPDSTCCHSLPDYQEYYDYDYQTGQYTTADTDTATLGQYYDYQYHGDTSTQGYSDKEYSHNHTGDAFIQTVTEDVAENVDNNEKYDFFPVKDIFQKGLIDLDSEEESSKSDESEEVNIVSLVDTSEKEESQESPDSTLHYEIISNTVESTDSENIIFSVDEDTSVDTEDAINRLNEINHNLLTDVAAENSIEKDEVDTIIKKTYSLSCETIEEDVLDNSADEA